MVRTKKGKTQNAGAGDQQMRDVVVSTTPPSPPPPSRQQQEVVRIPSGPSFAEKAASGAGGAKGAGGGRRRRKKARVDVSDSSSSSSSSSSDSSSSDSDSESDDEDEKASSKAASSDSDDSDNSSSDSDSDSDSSTTRRRKTSGTTITLTSTTGTTGPNASIPTLPPLLPHPIPTLLSTRPPPGGDTQTLERFNDYYMTLVTTEFGEELFAVRRAKDFGERSLPMLVRALRQGGGEGGFEVAERWGVLEGME